MGPLLTTPRRVLLITQWFDPEPVPKGLSFAKALREHGCDVEVLTGFPNYPDGKLYEGFALSLHESTEVDGITVHRAFLYPSHDRSAVRRAANYLSFFLSALFVGLVHVRRPDVIYAYHPPATVGWVGVLLGKRYGVPVILDVQDLWPDTVVSSGMVGRGGAIRLLDAICRWGYRNATVVVALSRGMATLLQQRGVAPSRTRVIRNWADESRIANFAEGDSSAIRGALGDGFSILFAGQMGVAQGLDVVLEAAAATPAIRWVFIGGGTERARLERRAADLRLDNVRFVGRVPMTEIAPWLRSASALLVNLSQDPLYAASIPSKTQSYMLAGRPILMSAIGDAADLVREARAGVVCAPGSSEALAQGARELMQMPRDEREALGANGREYYMRELSFHAGVARFAKVIDDLGEREPA